MDGTPLGGIPTTSSSPEVEESSNTISNTNSQSSNAGSSSTQTSSKTTSEPPLNTDNVDNIKKEKSTGMVGMYLLDYLLSCLSNFVCSCENCGVLVVLQIIGVKYMQKRILTL